MPFVIMWCAASKGQFTHENGAKASLCKHIQSKWKIPDGVTDPQLLLGLMKDFSKRQELLSRALTAFTTAFVKDGNTSMQHAFTGNEIREWVSNALGTELPKTAVQLSCPARFDYSGWVFVCCR